MRLWKFCIFFYSVQGQEDSIFRWGAVKSVKTPGKLFVYNASCIENLNEIYVNRHLVESKYEKMDNIPTHTINFSDKISCFELSSYEFTKNLICVALSDKIILGLLQFPVSSL